MRHIIRVMLISIFAAVVCGAGQTNAKPRRPVPAATFTQFQCTDFISEKKLPDTVQLTNGADNDIYEGLHTFTPGDLVYLHSATGHPFRDGEAFALVRPENGFFLSAKWLPAMIQNQVLPPSSLYPHQRLQIERLGHPYDNTGLIRVMKVSPDGAIARVVFACTAINPQDIAVPYVPQPIPDYLPGDHYQEFETSNGKLTGIIVAASAASPFLYKGSIAFLNIGRDQGVQPGQRYRIFGISRYNVSKGLDMLTHAPKTPQETLGELVILHVQGKAAEGIVIDNLREIAVGDGVQLE